jgi:DNA-directed RNA polymerase subunit RPC12/RpoP
MCLAAVQKNGLALMDVPRELKTAELCLAAVKNNGMALYYVPKELKTPEICLAAVAQSSGALEYVPEELITAEICLAAVKSGGLAFWFVPKAFKDEMRAVVKQAKAVSLEAALRGDCAPHDNLVGVGEGLNDNGNDDIFYLCPKCGSSDTRITSEAHCDGLRGYYWAEFDVECNQCSFCFLVKGKEHL